MSQPGESVEDAEQEVTQLPVPFAGTEYEVELDDMKLRALQLDLITRMIGSGNKQSKYSLLAHIDNAIEATAIATGRSGEEVRKCWLAGVHAFLSPL